MSLALKKKQVTGNAGKSTHNKTGGDIKTIAQTSKGGVRVAHVPQVVRYIKVFNGGLSELLFFFFFRTFFFHLKSSINRRS